MAEQELLIFLSVFLQAVLDKSSSTAIVALLNYRLAAPSNSTLEFPSVSGRKCPSWVGIADPSVPELLGLVQTPWKSHVKCIQFNLRLIHFKGESFYNHSY